MCKNCSSKKQKCLNNWWTCEHWEAFVSNKKNYYVWGRTLSNREKGIDKKKKEVSEKIKSDLKAFYLYAKSKASSKTVIEPLQVNNEILTSDESKMAEILAS